MSKEETKKVYFSKVYLYKFSKIYSKNSINKNKVVNRNRDYH